MKLLFKKSVSYLILLLLFWACIPSKPAPTWVSIQPTDQGYWYGIGIETNPFSSEYRENAKQKAINEIGFQIAVKISSEMTSMIRETNLRTEQLTEIISNSRIKLFLPEVEFVDTFSDGETFYFLARLNKSHYYSELEKRRQNAANTVSQYLVEAKRSSFMDAMEYYKTALDEMQPFLDSPFTVEFPPRSGRIENGYALLKTSVKNRINRIDISVNPTTVHITLFQDESKSISVKVVDQITGEPVNGLNLEFVSSFPNLSQSTRTGKDGKAVFRIGRLFGQPGTIKNNIKFRGINQFDGISFFKSLQEKMVSVQVILHSPKIFLKIHEKNLGNNISDLIVTPKLKSLLVEKLSSVFVQNENQADIKIVLNVTSVIKSKNVKPNYPIIAYASGTVDFINLKTNETYFSISTSDVKGGDFSSFEIAGYRSLEKLSNEISQIFGKKLETFYAK